MPRYRSTTPYRLPESPRGIPQLAQGVRWTFKQEQFQKWLSIPHDKRPASAKTLKEAAERLAVTVETLRNWKRLPGWWQAVFEQANALIGEELPEVLFALTTEAKAGSVSAIKLYLETLGVFTQRQEIDVYEEHLVVFMPGPGLPGQPAQVGQLTPPVPPFEVLGPDGSEDEDEDIQSESGGSPVFIIEG